MGYQGLFIGLTTLDFIYLSDRYPQANQKVVAQDYLTAAGGPATNAAVAFSYFGNQGKLITVLGQHPLCQLIKTDLENYPVEIVDLFRDASVSGVTITSYLLRQLSTSSFCIAFYKFVNSFCIIKIHVLSIATTLVRR